MTNFFGNNGVQNTAGDVPAPPGGTPNGTQMQGNPQMNQFDPFGVLPPNPQIGGAGQTVNSPLSHDQMSRGNVPLSAQVTNVGAAVGGVALGGPTSSDSLLAKLARGEVLLNQSTYGQGAFLPPNAGQAPQGPQAAQANVQSQPNGIASTLTVAAVATYSGN